VVGGAAAGTGVGDTGRWAVTRPRRLPPDEAPLTVVGVLADRLRAAVDRDPSIVLDKDTVVQVYGVSPVLAERALGLLLAQGAVGGRRRVTLKPGDRAFARRATREERQKLSLGRGEPVLVVQRAAGAVEVFAGDQVEIVDPVA